MKERERKRATHPARPVVQDRLPRQQRWYPTHEAVEK